MLLVLGTGQRCGSTLMQRLLCSHPEAFIWGEHTGHLETMLDAVEEMAAYSAGLGGQAGRRDWAALGHHAFIANLNPTPEYLCQAFVRFLLEVFANHPEAAGKPVWGFKEVRYDYDFARRIARFIHETKVILIVRDPRDILRSVDEWAQRGRWSDRAAENLVRTWLRVARSFIGFDSSSRVPVLAFRYEDYINSPDKTIEAVAEFTCLERSGFDAAVFGKRVHAHGDTGTGEHSLRSWDELPAAWHRLLEDEAVVRTAAHYGYSF